MVVKLYSILLGILEGIIFITLVVASYYEQGINRFLLFLSAIYGLVLVKSTLYLLDVE